MRLYCAFVSALALVVSSPSVASDWPTRTIRIIVPFAPGGTGDVLGRIVADHLANALKQKVVVENRPGAGGMLATKAASAEDPDGYTLILTNASTMSLIPAINPTTSYDPVKDFTHVSYIGGAPVLLTVSPSIGVSTVKQFIEYAQGANRTVTFGSTGIGSDGHVVGEAIGRALGIKVQHLPYRGGFAPAVADLIGGHITYLNFSIAQTTPLVKEGKLSALAVTSPERMRPLPDVPTFKELGYPSLVSLTWFSISAPAKLPRNIAEALNETLAGLLKKPETLIRFEQMGLITHPMSPEEMSAFVAAESLRWKPLIEAAGLAGKTE